MNVDVHKLEAGYLFPIIGNLLLQKINNFVSFIHHSFFFSLPFLVFILIFSSITIIARNIYILRKIWNTPKVFLEVTPPSQTKKSSYTTSQLFSVLHTLGYDQTFLNRLLGKKTIFSFEIVSTRKLGIRYIIQTPQDEEENVKRTLVSYLPGVQVKRVEDYLHSVNTTQKYHTKVLDFRLTKHFAYPLEKQDELVEHDPIAYITGQMTKLDEGEVVAMQLVMTKKTSPDVAIIREKILRNEHVLAYLNRIRIPLYLFPFIIVFKILVKVVQVVGKESAWAITEFVHGSSKQQAIGYGSYQQNMYLSQLQLKPARVLSSFEEQTVKSVQEKIDQSLFAASIRALVVMKTKRELKERVRGIKSSFAPYSVPKYQSLRAKYTLVPIVSNRISLCAFQNRLQSIVNNTSGNLLAISEVSDLYHFPFSSVTQTENISKSYSYELPAPVSLKQGTKFDVIFGRNMYAGVETLIGLTSDQRARHMVIFGGTGNGKTTLISEMIQQDMQNGKGLCFIDPHGDAVERALQMVPKAREKDVVWVDPYDIDRPLAINLMELTPGLQQNDALREKERVAEGIVSLFRRVCASDFSKAGNNAFRIENTLLNAIYTAFYVPDCTLFTIYDLLNDPAFLKKTVSKIEDKRLKDFWKNEFGRAGDYQIVKMVGGVTARIGKFLHSESARRIFEQPKSTLRFDQLMDSKKIILCNLSKGKLSEDISQVIGTAILTKIQLSIMARATILESERVPFYLYIDEFQNFASDYFVGMLSEARKYKLHIVIVEQSTSQQQDQNLINIILANVAVIICFRTANPADEEIILPQFAPLVKKGDIMNLPWFHFFIKIYAAVSQEPFTGETVPQQTGYDKRKAERIIHMSSVKYGNHYENKEMKRTTQDNGDRQEKENMSSKNTKNNGNPPDMN